jgi:hypothetical protein
MRQYFKLSNERCVLSFDQSAKRIKNCLGSLLYVANSIATPEANMTMPTLRMVIVFFYVNSGAFVLRKPITRDRHVFKKPFPRSLSRRSEYEIEHFSFPITNLRERSFRFLVGPVQSERNALSTLLMKHSEVGQSPEEKVGGIASYSGSQADGSALLDVLLASRIEAGRSPQGTQF